MKNFLIKCASIMLVALMLFGLAAPATFAAEKSELIGISNTYNGIKLDFNKIENASSYNFYRKTAETDWQFIGNKKNNSTTYYVDKDVESGVRYTYKIATVLNSEVMGEVELSYYFLSVPEYELSIGDTGVIVKITSVDGAESYQILRKDPINNNFKEVGSTKDSIYIDNSINSNIEYTYAVRAYKGKECSYITSQKIFAYPNLSLDNINDGIKISYQKVDDAVKYILYRSESGENWVKLNEIKPRSWYYFTDKTVSSGNYYRYKIEIVTSDGKTINSGASRIMYLKDTPCYLSSDGSSITIDFNAVPGAQYYQILRRDTGKTSYTEIKNIPHDADTFTYTDTNVVEGKSYDYAIRAWNGQYCSYLKSSTIENAYFVEDCIESINEFIIPSEFNESIDIADISFSEGVEEELIKTPTKFDFISLIKDILTQIFEYCITFISKI